MILRKWHQGAFSLRTAGLTLVLPAVFLVWFCSLLQTSSVKKSMLTNSDSDGDLQNEGVRQDLKNDLPLSHDLKAHDKARMRSSQGTYFSDHVVQPGGWNEKQPANNKLVQSEQKQSFPRLRVHTPFPRHYQSYSSDLGLFRTVSALPRC